MPQRLEIAYQPHLADPAGRALAAKARDYLGLKIVQARQVRVLTFDCGLEPEHLGPARELFTNPVSEQGGYTPLADLVLPGFDWALWVGYRPGVRDNAGATALEALADALGLSFGPDHAVYTSQYYLLEAPNLHAAQAEELCAQLLANGLIQTWRVIPRGQWTAHEGVGITIPKVKLTGTPQVRTFAIGSDQELLELSRQRDLYLNPADVPVIRAYFDDPAVRESRRAVGLDAPTDVELEYISQARSDHCNHNTFGGRFFYRDLMSGEEVEIANLFKETIKAPTERLAAQKDWVVSVLWDNAGVAKLDDTHNYVITGETHNSPSNMEAYGGALTGIVGVYRDPMGTGLGSKLIAGMWGFCTGPRDYTGEFQPVLHPRRLLDGVIQGVKDGGNKSGIPTTYGLLQFDERHLGKCLVFVCAVGMMPATVGGRPSHEKTTSPGELCFMCGGRVGADGIHGVTASSAGFDQNTPAGHVQIGDPYTQKKMSDFLLEARDLGLIPYITDNGGGGLSSSVGESARLSGGAVVDLASVPLKYEGLEPWQIWVSESQERMTVAVRPADAAEFLRLADKHQVEATAIGRFTDDGMLMLKHGDQVAAYVDVKFLEHGFPQWRFEAQWLPPAARGLVEPVLGVPADLGGLLLDLLDHPNHCDRSWITRQYDHEVQGSHVLGPLVGRAGVDVPAEASVIWPVLDGPVGLAMTQVLNTPYGDIDTYHMVTASIEESLRRLVAVGGDPTQTGGVDNFCWPGIQYDAKDNPDGRYKAAQLVRACWALKDACLALEIPLLSGKDSMYVDGKITGRRGHTRRISGPTTMMFTATAPVAGLDRVQSPEPKKAGDYLYVLGDTADELGGSALYGLLGHTGLNVPATDLAACGQRARAVADLLGQGLPASVATPAAGGLGLCLARMVLASGLGLEVELEKLPGADGLDPLRLLFSESTGRYVFTVAPGQAKALEKALAGQPLARVGRVRGRGGLRATHQGQQVAALGFGELKRAYTRRFGKLV